MIFWWRALYVKRTETEIAWLRAELQYERDRNMRLEDALVSLKLGVNIGTVAPSVPRQTPAPNASLDALTHNEDFMRAGMMDEEVTAP